MLVKRIAAYPSVFNRLRAIARYCIGRKLQLLPTPLHLTPQLGVFPLEFREKFGPQKTRIMAVKTRQWRQFDDRLSRFDTIPAYDWQTDRRPAYINNVRSMTGAR